MSVTDDEYVARVESAIADWRARNAAWMEAISRIQVDPVHEAVTARFDSNGALQQLDIDAAALSDYTNTELEQIITEVLQQTRARVYEQMMDLFAKYLAPSDPRFPTAIGKPYVQLPE